MLSMFCMQIVLRRFICPGEDEVPAVLPNNDGS